MFDRSNFGAGTGGADSTILPSLGARLKLEVLIGIATGVGAATDAVVV
jgi:hypothetical protein